MYSQGYRPDPPPPLPRWLRAVLLIIVWIGLFCVAIGWLA